MHVKVLSQSNGKVTVAIDFEPKPAGFEDDATVSTADDDDTLTEEELAFTDTTDDTTDEEVALK